VTKEQAVGMFLSYRFSPSDRLLKVIAFLKR
jgi:hypothetical protein